MPDNSLPPRSIAVMANPQVSEAYHQAQEVAAALQDHGAAVSCGMLNDEALRQQIMKRDFDLLIALGGDGTMLRAGHLCAPVQVPILGINMGRFGFLTEVEQDEWRAALPRLLQGDYRLEKRMMISASQWRGGQRLGDWEVLNEIVVCRDHLVRPVHLEASVDSRFLSTYVADALIAATPTGSTAYALAAGGPILPPELRNILLVAVAPHLSIDRAIVLAEGSTVNITVVTEHQAVLSPDGQAPIALETGDQITACASEHSALFVRFQDPGYFYRNLTPHLSQNPSTGNHR